MSKRLRGKGGLEDGKPKVTKRDPMVEAGFAGKGACNLHSFENWLRAKYPYGYGIFIGVKGEALKTGKHPIRAFREVVAKKLGHEVAKDFWMEGLASRCVDPDESDLEFLRSALEANGIDCNKLVVELDDRRRLASVIVAMNLEGLKGAKYPYVYAVVGKLLEENRDPTKQEMSGG
jgi:hypothetical protein